MTLAQAIRQLSQQLPEPEAKLEASLMLQRALGVTRAFLHTYPEKELSTTQHQQLDSWLARRLTGEPLAYIFGETEFYGLTLAVSPAVLIPRADTELLVDCALELIPEQLPTNIVDMGTGSGAIAIAIATYRPLAQVTAVDISRDALSLAQDNVCRYRLPIHCLLSHWFEQLPQQKFDMIVSNPPYIRDNDPHLTQTSLPFEPQTALTSGEDGLADIRQLIAQAPTWLNRQGWLLIEHGYDQGQVIRTLFQDAGFSQVTTRKDLGNNDRLTLGQWNHA